jgi:putative inorganic carbon (HCO3(-)) transporter
MRQEKIIVWCDKIIDWLTMAVIFLTPLYFAYFAENYNVFELNKLLIVRIGVSLILFLWFVKISLGAKVFYFNKKLLGLALAVLLIYIFPGVVFSTKPYLSFWGSYERQQGIYSLIYYWLFFVLLIFNLRSWRQVKNLILAALAASGLVCLYGIAQHFNLDPQKWQEMGRAFSALGQPNFLGHYLIMVIPLTVSGWWLFKNRSKYFWLPLLLILQLACLLFTSSRAAWLGLILSGLIILAVFSFISKRRKIILLIIATFLVAVSLSAVFYKAIINDNLFLSKYYGRFATSFNLNSEANQARLRYWSAVPQEFLTTNWWHRLVGFGKDSQAGIFVKYYKSDWGLYEAINSFPDRAHNLILDIWLEFGLIGLAVLAAFALFLLLSSLNYLWHERQHKDDKYYLVVGLLAAMLGYFFAALFGFPLTTHYLYYYWLAAVLAWLLFGGQIKELKLDGLSLAFKWSITVIVILFTSFTLYMFTVKPFIADIWLMKAKKAEAVGDCAQIISYSNKMLDAWPASLEIKEQYAWLNINCLSALTNKNDIIAVLYNVIDDLDSYPVKERGYHFLVNQAHAYSLFGYYLDPKYYAQAEAVYQTLLKLNPNLSVTYQDYARMKMWAGDYEAAARIVERGLAITPPVSAAPGKSDIIKQNYDFYDLLGKIQMQKKDPAKALVYFSLAQKTNPEEKAIYQKLADLSWQLSKTEAAISWLEEGKKVDPSDNAWDYDEALYYKKLGKTSEALAAINRALVLKPDDEEAKKLLADITAGLKTRP